MEDGIYTDISIKDYHSNKTHISSTQIKKAKTSLKHFHWYTTGKIVQEQKGHFDFGNAFELALLDKVGYLNSVAVFPDQDFIDQAMQSNPELKTPRNSNVYKEAARKWESEHKGKYVINETGPQSFEVIEEMLSSCFQDSTIQALISNTEYQLSLFWTDEETGLKLKTRPDICKRHKNVIVNVKTIEDGSPDAFTRELAKYDYPMQACIEMMGCTAPGLMDKVDAYFWLVCEKSAPFNATIYEFVESDIKVCMDSTRYHLMNIKRAREQNKYPGYSNESDNVHGIMKAKLPGFYHF
jgi:hypothetical protein